MPSMEKIIVDLHELATSGQKLNVSLEDDFFKGLEQDEILGGDVEAQLSAREGAGEIFEVSMSAKGFVRVVCDRCLDELILPVQAEDVIEIGSEQLEDMRVADMRLLQKGEFRRDLGWCLYELIELSLPLQRTHEINECNPDMVKFLTE